jgi:acyl-CoA synthetase (AMP-forming)/AMP-acid ligase II
MTTMICPLRRATRVAGDDLAVRCGPTMLAAALRGGWYRIAAYKVPRHVEVRSEPLPKSGAGKVLKRELRKPYWKDQPARVGGV